MDRNSNKGRWLFMEMIVHLDEDIFEVVQKGIKNVEVRVNDEKRRKLHIGDKLIFLKRPLEIEKINAVVKRLDYYQNFDELVKHYDMDRLYLDSYTKEDFIKLLGRFYSKDEIEKYGVVAIIFRKD